MKRLFQVSMFALLLPALAAAQTAPAAPDNDLILKAISDGTSRWYYPNLMGRYLAGDTTLTGEDFRYLYYGFAFQDAYRPLDPAPQAVDNLFSTFGANTSPNFDQCLALAKAGEEALKVDPFNLQIINILIFAYGSVDNRSGERINYFRFNNVINTVKSSGTGLTEKSPWHVLTFATAHDILNVMGLQPVKSVAVSKTVEFIPLLVKDGDARGYYFDYSRVYWKRPEVIPQPKRGFGINGMSLK